MTNQSAMPELKPCPFCGGEPILNHIEPHSHHLTFDGKPLMPDYPGSWTIECCDVGMIKDTREEVVTAWNRRALSKQGEPAAVVVDLENDDGNLIPKHADLRVDLPVGAKLYTAPPQAEAAPVADEPRRLLARWLKAVRDLGYADMDAAIAALSSPAQQVDAARAAQEKAR